MADGRSTRQGRSGRGISSASGFYHGIEHHGLEHNRLTAGLHHGLERRILLSEIDAYLKTRASEPCFVRDYTIFWLYYREGLTAKAISRAPSIGLTVKGVESTLLRLTRLVRRRLQQKSVGLKSGPASPAAARTHPPG